MKITKKLVRLLFGRSQVQDVWEEVSRAEIVQFGAIPIRKWYRFGPEQWLTPDCIGGLIMALPKEVTYPDQWLEMPSVEEVEFWWQQEDFEWSTPVDLYYLRSSSKWFVRMGFKAWFWGCRDTIELYELDDYVSAYLENLFRAQNHDEAKPDFQPSRER